jgi:hypothetical protein
LKEGIVDGNESGSLADLKNRYLSLEAVFCESRNDVYWKQGQILIQIKAQLRHGEWRAWIEKNLHIDRTQAQLRMKIGSLPSLPKRPENRSFQPTLEVLAKIADVAATHKLTPDAATEKYLKDFESQKARFKKQGPEPGGKKRRASSNIQRGHGMTREQALRIFGIDIDRRTIEKRYLEIFHKALRQKLHPDKGGKHDDFIALDKAYAALGGT